MPDNYLNFAAVLRCIYIVIIGLLPFMLRAQIVIVSDAVSKAPLSNTLIYNSNKSVTTYTDKDGKASLEAFSLTDTLFFEHEGYAIRPYLTKLLQLYNYKVSLFPDVLLDNQKILSFSLFEERKKDIPISVSLKSNSQANFLFASSPLDLLSFSGNLYVQKWNQLYGNVMQNGYDSRNTFFSLDGVPLNAVWAIDVNSISQIELYNYSSPLVYANQNSGGIAYFKSIQPQVSSSDSAKKIALYSLLKLSTVNQGLSAHLRLNISFKKAGFMTMASVGNFKSYKTGANRSHGYSDWGKVNYYATTANGIDTLNANSNTDLQTYTGYQRSDIIQKAHFLLNSTSTIAFHLQYSNISNIYNSSALNSTDTISPLYSEWHYDPLQYLLAYASIHSWKTQKMFDEYKIITAYQNTTITEVTRAFQSLERRQQNNNKQTYSLSLHFFKKLDVQKKLNYGFESNRNQLLSNAIISTINTQISRDAISEFPSGGSYWQDYATYINYTLALKKISFMAGARLTYSTLQASTNDSTAMDIYGSRFERIFLGVKALAGFQFHLGTKNELCYLFSTFNQNPTINELLKFSFDGNYFHLPNPNLTSSYCYKNELGVKIYSISDKILFYPSLFVSYISKAYSEKVISNTGTLSHFSQYSSIGNTLIYGASYQCNIKVGEFSQFESGLFYTKGIELSNQQAAPYIPPLSGKTSFTYQYKKFNYQVYAYYNGIKAIESYSIYDVENKQFATQDGVPAWATLNMSMDLMIYKNMNLVIGIENIFDQQYIPYGSSISAPGRNIIMLLRTTL